MAIKKRPARQRTPRRATPKPAAARKPGRTSKRTAGKARTSSKAARPKTRRAAAPRPARKAVRPKAARKLVAARPKKARTTVARKSPPPRMAPAPKAAARRPTAPPPAPPAPAAGPADITERDRSASAVLTGRHEMAEHRHEHPESGPELTGGDIDANWELAYSSGDEAPGGDNPTPDQDIVDEIGQALGVRYQNGEELKGSEKITERDRHRWELDPASSEDYPDRQKHKR